MSTAVYVYVVAKDESVLFFRLTRAARPPLVAPALQETKNVPGKSFISD